MWRQNHRGLGRPNPRGRNGSGPTPRGDRGRGGHVTLGPDPPRGGQATWVTAATQASSHDTPGPMSPTAAMAPDRKTQPRRDDDVVVYTQIWHLELK
ncbi:hypothetical protein [Oryza sativa Japonica Group]|uniref:Uncharacterized protein n=1 Tax=Oryza sativa subsp. japonica TaxID=39947 RepID=Q5ZBY4_ORYSJ|nr:hypothetical protein [Oryza sativa Japonica Group]